MRVTFSSEDGNGSNFLKVALFFNMILRKKIHKSNNPTCNMLYAHNTNNDKAYSILTDVRNAYKILAEKLKMLRPFGESRRRYEDDIRSTY